MTAPRRNRKLLAGLAASALSLAFTFLLLEAGARLFLDVSDVPWHVGDPIVGYRLEPRQEGCYHAEGAKGTFRVNNRGFNNDRDYQRPRLPGVARIALLGDSYVEAFVIPRGRRVFENLETLLRGAGVPAEVDSYGISGFGTCQEMRLLESEVLSDRPDLVVVLFVQNDPADSACALGGGGPKPCFTLDPSGAPIASPWPPHRPNRLARIAMHSALLRYLAIDRDLASVLQRSGHGAGESFETIYATHPDAPHAEAWQVVESCLARMADDCARAHTAFLLIHQPILPLGSAGRLAAVPGGAEAGALAKRFAGIASRHGFTFFDLGPAFGATADDAAERFLNRGVAHWNAEAHRVAAQALLEPVLRLLPPAYGAQTSVSGTVEAAPNEPAPHALRARTR